MQYFTKKKKKKNKNQKIDFKKKDVVKISRISSSKSPPWKLVRFRSEPFLEYLSRIPCWIFFSFEFELIINYKKPWFLR